MPYENSHFFFSSKLYDKEYPSFSSKAFLELRIRLNYQGSSRHSEFLIFDPVTFMSDIGGYLGLLLGYALLSLIDIMEIIKAKFCVKQDEVAPVQPLMQPRERRRIKRKKLKPVQLTPERESLKSTTPSRSGSLLGDRLSGNRSASPEGLEKSQAAAISLISLPSLSLPRYVEDPELKSLK